MSESVLRALMQLFAIIGGTAEEDGELMRSLREKVAFFLRHQIASSRIETYLEIYDGYFSEHTDRLQKSRNSLKHRSRSSVRLIRICEQINEDLTLEQKFVVLARLIEFARQSDALDAQQLEFITGVSDTFHITREELYELLYFASSDTILPATTCPNAKVVHVLEQQDDKAQLYREHLVLYRRHLNGELIILKLERANLYLVRYIGLSNLYLAGQPLQLGFLYVLSVGSTIRGQNIPPLYYGDVVECFTPPSVRDKIRLEVEEVSYKFSNGAYGLRNISFRHNGGQLVGILGASGSGKSTLLSVLNGQVAPTKGRVLLNESDIHTQHETIHGILGFVAQDDLLIDELTVYQNLYYGAKLSLASKSKQEREQLVEACLQSLGLYEIRDLRVGNPLDKRISGGQRKRLNIALSLIREPSILFLDEPTSGLSSRDSENVMELLKELTLHGRLIYVVIHQPSSDIFKMFDSILILDTGGYLIYYGDPVESVEYFQNQSRHIGLSEAECPTCGNVNVEQIFDIVEAPVVDEYGKATRERRTKPEEWYARFEESRSRRRKNLMDIVGTIPPIEAIPHMTRIPSHWRQLITFITRDALAKLANVQYVIINILEAPLLALLLAAIVRYFDVGKEGASYTLMENSNLPVYIFMTVIVAFFAGVTGSAEDIIKDRKIRLREAFLNLSWGAYIGAKMLNVMILAFYQALVFTLIGNAIIGISGGTLTYLLILFATWVSASMLGLIISDTFKTVVTIYILIPFLVIPQIILSGVLVRFDHLNPSLTNYETVPWYGEGIVARWAYEALAVQQFRNNDYTRPLYHYEQLISLADYKRNFWLTEMRVRLTQIENKPWDESTRTAWHLLQNELADDADYYRGSGLAFPLPPTIWDVQPTPTLCAQLSKHLDRLHTYYGRMYSRSSQRRDSILRTMQGRTAAEHLAFKELKESNYNVALAKLLKVSEDTERISEYNEHLIQHYDPVYQLPRRGNLKAHFYAPYKRLGNIYIDTYWLNLTMLVLSVLLQWLVLYVRLFKRLIDWLGRLFDRKLH